MISSPRRMSRSHPRPPRRRTSADSTRATSPRVVRRAGPGLCDTIVVAVTGSVGALWAAQFVLHVRSEGEVRDVRVVMTASAARFVTPAAMRAVSGHVPLVDLYAPSSPYAVGHVQVTEGAGVLVVMPATANVLAKAAQGLADDAVSATILAAACPVVFVPNMNERMWRSAPVQRNVRTLIGDGHTVVTPVEGVTISTGRPAIGAMPDFDAVVSTLRRVVRHQG